MVKVFNEFHLTLEYDGCVDLTSIFSNRGNTEPHRCHVLLRESATLRAVPIEAAFATSADLQHPIQCHPRPVFHVAADLDLVHYAAVDQVLKRPRQMLGADAVHGGAEAAGDRRE